MAEILAWEREIGLSETSVEIERNSWILLSAAYPVHARDVAGDEADLSGRRGLPRLVLAMDRAIDWDRDDPRLVDLAEVSMAVLERLYPAELAHAQAGQWTGTDDVTVGLLTRDERVLLTGLAAALRAGRRADPGARLPGLLTDLHL